MTTGRALGAGSYLMHWRGEEYGSVFKEMERFVGISSADFIFLLVDKPSGGKLEPSKVSIYQHASVHLSFTI